MRSNPTSDNIVLYLMKHRPCKRLTDLCFVFFNTTFFGLRPITHFGNPTARPFRLTITNLTKLANPNHFLFEKHGLRPHHSQFPIVGRANFQSARVDFHRVFHTVRQLFRCVQYPNCQCYCVLSPTVHL